MLEPSLDRRTLIVPDDMPVRRADRFVADRTGLSRSYVQRLIADGRLTADGRPIRARDPLPAGSTVVLDVPEAREALHLTPDRSIVVPVVYEDDDLLVIDKPAGLVVHPAPGHWDGTLVNALLARQPGEGSAGFGGI